MAAENVNQVEHCEETMRRISSLGSHARLAPAASRCDGFHGVPLPGGRGCQRSDQTTIPASRLRCFDQTASQAVRCHRTPGMTSHRTSSNSSHSWQQGHEDFMMLPQLRLLPGAVNLPLHIVQYIMDPRSFWLFLSMDILPLCHMSIYFFQDRI